MKKAIILSCSTGQGHNSCAKAIKEYFEYKNVSCEIYEAMDFISRRFSDFLSWGHSTIYRNFPGLFRWGYRYSEEHPAVFEKGSRVYKILTAGCERMYKYVSAGKFDTVICTHVFAAIILTHMLNLHPMPIQTAFIATDYTCHPGVDSINMQKYFIPDKNLSEDFKLCGIPQERMTATGIPVCREFLSQINKTKAKCRLNISTENKHLLVMCGSMGCGPITEIIQKISAILPRNAEVSVICGTNRRLYAKLKRKYTKYRRIHIIGYTNKVSLYMDSADFYITKPGGISVTEAAAKKLPMAFVNAVAGCEQYNMDFFVNMGAAITAASSKELAERSVRILCSDEERNRMVQVLKAYHQEDGAKNVFKEIN